MSLDTDFDAWINTASLETFDEFVTRRARGEPTPEQLVQLGGVLLGRILTGRVHTSPFQLAPGINELRNDPDPTCTACGLPLRAHRIQELNNPKMHTFMGRAP